MVVEPPSSIVVMPVVVATSLLRLSANAQPAIANRTPAATAPVSAGHRNHFLAWRFGLAMLPHPSRCVIRRRAAPRPPLARCAVEHGRAARPGKHAPGTLDASMARPVHFRSTPL